MGGCLERKWINELVKIINFKNVIIIIIIINYFIII